MTIANRDAQVSGLSILGYSTVLPIVWLSLGGLLAAILPGTRTGVGGFCFVVLIVVLLTSWLFVRKHRRRFSTREFWMLVGWCSLWAALCESAGLLYAASVGLVDPSQTRMLTFAACFSFGLDAIIIVVGFGFTGRRFIDHYLAEHPE